jgi:hypothetical protein
MRFLFQHFHYFLEPFNVGGRYAPHDASFQMGQVPADTAGQLSTLRCQPNQKSAAIDFSNLARDQAAVRKTIENTGQCRSFVGEAAMEIGYFRRRAIREQRQNVRFALGQPGFAQSIKVEADSVRCPVNWMNEM